MQNSLMLVSKVLFMKSLACVIHCLFIIYLVANYRPLTWITSFIYMCLTILYDQDYDGSMSPQKLLCFYHLPTRGRVGTKLGDADTSQTYL